MQSIKQYILLVGFFVSSWVLAQNSIIQLQQGSNHAAFKTAGRTVQSVDLTLSSLALQDTTAQGEQFVNLSADGFTTHNKAGHPDIPVFRQIIELPDQHLPTINVNASKKKTQLLPAAHLLFPVQPALSKREDKPAVFVKNQGVYGQEKTYTAFDAQTNNPSDFVEIQYLGQQGNKHLALLSIAPVQYNIQENSLDVYTQMNVSLTYATTAVQTPQVLGSSTAPLTYIIISSPDFAAEIAPLVQWKTQKGFRVIVAYTNQQGVGASANTIRTYIKNFYTNANDSIAAPSYVLLVGDVAQVPSFSGKTGSHYTDLYYGEFTNDYLPEAQVGRLSGSTAAHISNQVQKIITYEKYTLTDPSYLANGMLVAGNDKSYGESHMNPQINYALTYVNKPNGFNVTPYFYPQSATQDANVQATFNNGTGFLNYTGHGSTNGWNDPTFKEAEISAMSNTGKYGIVINNACITNTFSIAECYCEAVVRADNKGAVACIGGSNDTYWDEDYYWAVGNKAVVNKPLYEAANLGAYDRLFHTHQEADAQWVSTLGQIMQAGNMAVQASGSVDANYYWEVYNLMGDPSMMPYLAMPITPVVSHGAVIPLNATALTVTAEPYMYVGLSVNDTLLAAGYTDAQGKVVLNFIPVTTVSTAKLVCTGHNKKPYITDIDIKWPQESYIQCNNILVDDSTANINGLAESGENLYITLDMSNYGQTTANKVNITVTTTSTDISITQPNAFISAFDGNTNKLVENSIRIQVNNQIQDYTDIPLQISMTDSMGYTWTSYKSFRLYAPALQLSKTIVHDTLAFGNKNGRLEPGESAVIELFISNSGHASAIPVTVSIADTTTSLILLTTSASIDTLTPGSTTSVSFMVEAPQPITPGSVVLLEVTQQNLALTYIDTCVLPVGFLIEDFETSPSPFVWNNISSIPWEQSDSLAYSGTYCYRSGRIGDLSATALSINYKVLQDDSISFYYRVSSESPFDKLGFFIDNVSKGEWSDELDWTRAVFAVSSGNHIFKWTYSKDKNTAYGKDAAWIDQITFPPVGIYDVAVKDLTTDYSQSNVWHVYPSPASSFIRLISENHQGDILLSDIRIINSMGEEVKALLISQNGQYTIDIHSLTPGVYVIVINSNGISVNKKFIKM